MAKTSISRPWKATLQSHPNKSLLSLHSLWDVIYDKGGKPLIDMATSQMGGFKLEHDIICYSTQEYSSASSIYTDTASVSYNNETYSADELYETLCIDASIAQYDSRAKTLKGNCDSSLTPSEYVKSGTSLMMLLNNSQMSSSIFQDGVYELHDKDSVLMPADLADFVSNGVYYDDKGIQADYIPSGLYHAPYTAIKDDSNPMDRSFPIYLIKSDLAFRGTLSTSVTMSAYNRIVFNPHHKWVATLVMKALYKYLVYKNGKGGVLNPNIKWNDPTGSIYTTTDTLPDYCNFVFTELPKLIDNANYAKDLYEVDPKKTWATILKNTYIWIKAPFFGDYIEPDVFNQDLDSTADVIHRNIILSNSADYNKYDASTSKNDKFANTQTLPYVPNVSPTLDLLTKNYTNAPTLSSLSQDQMEQLINNGDSLDKNTSNIGSIAIAPELRDGHEDIRLPNYFDPESKVGLDQYARTPNSHQYHLPTIVPVAGNLYIDGRVISPTTDEIWTYLKQLTEGRMSDAEVEDSIDAKDIALPIGTRNEEHINRVNLSDTRLTMVPDSEFQFKVVKDGTTKQVYGDVLKVEGKLDATGDNYIVNASEYINNNDGIKYHLYDAIKNLSKEITEFDQNKDEESGIKSRDVTNFTAWSKVGHYNEKIDNGSVVTDTQTIWAPRNAPYSLRELEALLLGNKYNTISVARFVKENFTVSGALGYEEKAEDGTTLAAGSLYQMHRNYNYKVDNPNTFFRIDGEGNALLDSKGHKDPKAGMDATFSDLTHNEEDGIKLYDSEDLKRSKMPLLVENYGKSIYLSEESGEYRGTDVYMAADGTWRYKNEHVRIPILRSRY